MPVAIESIQSHLVAGDFRGLFKSLNWDVTSGVDTILVRDEPWQLERIAEKTSFQVLRVLPDADGQIPDKATRQRIDNAVTKVHREHLLIFTDAKETQQIWRWVQRERGQTSRQREWSFNRGTDKQTGAALAQRVQQFAISLREELEGVELYDILLRVTDAMQVEKVTKKFYERYRKEHEDFRDHIDGIEGEEDRNWYASVMLNRLMFIYFIQKKGFVDANPNYLKDKLAESKKLRGKDKFHTFYRQFLRKMFHDGLGKPERPVKGIIPELGKVPYLNGGLFDVHTLEEGNDGIDIPDKAFTQLFTFFDEYQWTLDESGTRADNEINPDVLGYIFEKYINQKQMGAYYTKEDITGYISQNTIIPALFDKARALNQVAFAPDGPLWDLLREDPDRYIYEAVRFGVDEPLPPRIAAGMKDITKRTEWNTPAAAPFALPTETWREHIARRQRCHALRATLAAGEVTTIDDLITHNLHIRQFALDAIDTAETADLVRAFWQAVQETTVLDPTCGSGAFLFAALNILEPLYSACLRRMQSFINEAEQSAARDAHQRYADFRATIVRIEDHPNRNYFILKSIVLNNLFGVDIMEEAVEICKLRLFLKLAAQLERDSRIEPLPDIDFNIRAGNAIVGFLSIEEARQAIQGSNTGQQRIDLHQDMAGILDSATLMAQSLARFRRLQADAGNEDLLLIRQAKAIASERLSHLGEVLDRASARGYLDKVRRSQQAQALVDWRSKSKPLHWFVEFHDIIEAGGFSVVVGNPPYVGYSASSTDEACGVMTSFAEQFRTWNTVRSGNLYGLVTERSLQLVAQGGSWGMIVPLSITFSGDMASVRQSVKEFTKCLWLSSYDNIPDRAFTGAKSSDNTSKANQQRVTIALGRVRTNSSAGTTLVTTPTLRWRASERQRMFADLPYHNLGEWDQTDDWPKLGVGPASQSLFPLVRDWPCLGDLAVRDSEFQLTIPKTAGYFISAYESNIKKTKEATYSFKNQNALDVATVVLNSNLFFWWYRVWGDGFDVTRNLVLSCPVPPKPKSSLANLADKVREAQEDCAVYKMYRGVAVPNVNLNLRMDVCFECDRWLLGHLDLPVQEIAADLLRYKSSSWFSFEIAKSSAWPKTLLPYVTPSREQDGGGAA